jgi:hypothetical protein
MRVMALALASMLAVFVTDSQAFAAKRGSSIANLDRQYYAYGGSCSGSNAYIATAAAARSVRRRSIRRK